MKANKNYLMIAAAAVSIGMFLFINGCEKSSNELGKAASESVRLCSHCGHIKSSTLCCQPNLPKCLKCGLAKGSPGCCNIPKDAKAPAICTNCGQMKGGKLCCKANQPKCSMCGLVKDSPGCCKLPKI
jgi:hypothetical protein